MIRSIALLTEYDGTRFSGWQSQSNGRTVQHVLESALEGLFDHPVKVTGCSRTDSGVHALGHVSHFEARGSIPTERIPYALNAVLPDDLVVRYAKEVPVDFHARYDACAKRYVYRIRNTRCRPVLDRATVSHEPRPLDVDAMVAAAAFLIGRHDYYSFMAAGSTAKTTVRTLYDIRICRDLKDSVIAIHVTGDGFLYNMVRILSGTLLYAGLGKILPEDLPGILAARDRRQAGKTLPARGLTLEAVFYPMNGRIETLDGESLPPAWTEGEAKAALKGEAHGT